MEPKILLLDIETKPDLAWVWRVYDSNAIQVHAHWQLLSYSAEWLASGKSVTRGLCDFAGYKPSSNDKALAQDLWHLLDEADIVVAHNGLNFDIRKINARFIAHGMTPPSPYKVVDTRVEASRVAAFSSNKLDWLCRQLEIGHKLEKPDGYQMWLDCIDGDVKAWARMKRYNRHDVVLLKQLYTMLSPWIKQPNANLWSDRSVCPNPACGSKNIQYRGTYLSEARRYRRFQCKDCGKWGHDTHSTSGVFVKGV